MPLCFTLIRSAVRKWPCRQSSRSFLHPHKPQWLSIRSHSRSYSTVLAERQRDEDAKVWAEDTYLDFVLGERQQDDSVQEPTPDDQPESQRAKPSLTRRNRRVGNETSVPARVNQSSKGRLALSQAERALTKARRTAIVRDKHVRPATKSLRSELRASAVHSSFWNTRYSSLVRRYDRALGHHHLGPENAVPLSADSFERIDEVLDYLDSAPKDSSWSLTPIAQRYGKLEREIWSETALWLVCYDKLKLMNFLLATNTMLYPPINWVEDSLQVLARHFAHTPHRSEEIRSSRLRRLVHTFTKLLDRETKEQFVFGDGFVRSLLPYCSEADADNIWASIKMGKIKVHFNTILHFAEYFIVNRDQLERSLDALLEAHHAGAATSSVAFRSGCATLLRRSSSHPGGFRMCLRLVEHLAELGVRLDTRLYNIIMLNAIEAGDLETCNTLYRAMLEQGLTPDKYTCAIRLKACKLDIDNADMLRAVIQDAITYGDVRTEPLVSSEVLHRLALHHAKHHPQTAFATLAAAYSQFFDTTPLEGLGLKLPPSTEDAADDTHKRMQPARHAITYMLSVYLDRNASSDEAIALYTRWRQLVADGKDPVLADCATTPHLSNIFLQRFTRTKRTLLQAAQVVKDMQKPPTTISGNQQAPPDIITWSIFLHGFAQRGETKLAEQVLAYMRSKGMEPDHVTWTSLMNGYAGKQDAEGLLGAVRRAEVDGMVWNEWTRKGTKRFRDQQKLRELLGRQRLERDLDFTGDIKGKLADALTTRGEVSEVERRGSRVEAEEGVAPPGDGEGFADSTAELAELAGSFKQL